MYHKKNEPSETNETSSTLSLEVTQEQKEAIYHFVLLTIIGNLKKFKFLQIMIKAGMIQVMEIILLGRMTNLMNVCIVSVDHALVLQMKEIDSFGGRKIIK
jgi:hypothetical protein